MTTEPNSGSENPVDAEVAANQKPPKEENFWVETVKTLAIAALLALGLRQFVAQAFFIPSGSMEPTLLVDDRLIVDRVSYRFSNPQRGDIIVFDPTETLQKMNQKEAFIKRVIGLPGDTVEVRDDKVTINGKPLSENYPSTQHPAEMTQLYLEINKKKPEVGLWNPAKKGPNFPQSGQINVVPAGQYLVLGDHRSNSSDSRVWGFVPKDKIVGKAVVRFWPLNRLGGLGPNPNYTK
jgi:signal peptidase I